MVNHRNRLGNELNRPLSAPPENNARLAGRFENFPAVTVRFASIAVIVRGSYLLNDGEPHYRVNLPCRRRSHLDFFCQNIPANFAGAMLALAKLEILDMIVRAISVDMVDSFVS